LAWLKTKSAEFAHRKAKRLREVELAIQQISRMLDQKSVGAPVFEVLEFGSGDGFQVPFLETIGSVVASDVYVSKSILQKKENITFVESDITSAPFRTGQFYLVFSNHVMEHVSDLNQAFKELKRIGKADCLFAFAVPTNIWLLLTIPAQYLAKAQRVIRYIRGKTGARGRRVDPNHQVTSGQQEEHTDSSGKRMLRFLLPQGHGVHQGFMKCFSHFRIKRWGHCFESNGLRVRVVCPLLLYGPSEFPLIPTTAVFSRFGVCSSVLFLLEKRQSETDGGNVSSQGSRNFPKVDLR
jgi:SAM-dependent methyltransferase